MMIEDFGARVASVWEGLSSKTRKLIVGALQTPTANPTTAPQPHDGGARNYDPRSDWELSRLLSALDERVAEQGKSLSAEQSREMRHMAETCAALLQNQTRSAEVFAQLVLRAHRAHDFARIDQLADALAARFTPSEMCELARHDHPVVRALANEALAQSPTSMLVALLADEVDAEIARDALERQAEDYGNEEARQIVYLLDQADMADDAEDDA
ncbi:MAG: hypothetical protein JOZ52_08650 [Acidobacteria bacterium]|nr:hypothetical protein [Acidobacteriota bacterium]